jgi:LruC domain-containing protein
MNQISKLLYTGLLIIVISGLDLNAQMCIDPADPNTNAVHTGKYYSYEFYFEDAPNTPIIGTSTSNTPTITTVGGNGFVPATFTVHVSCSDDFLTGTGGPGYGEKDGPYQAQGHPRVISYNAWKYKNAGTGSCYLDKTCGSFTGVGPNDISGKLFQDTNGDNNVDGTGINQPGGTQMYANLVYNGSVIASETIANDGSYTFSGFADGSYSVVISTSQSSTSGSLPTNWNHTGENVGLTGNDGTADGAVSVTVNGSDVTNVNFGVDFNAQMCFDPADPNTNATYSGQYYSYEFYFEDAPNTPVRGTSTSNTPTITTVGGNGFASASFVVHISCSDDFLTGTGGPGYGEKDGPYQAQGHPRVISYQAWKYKDAGSANCNLNKTCSSFTGIGSGSLSGNVFEDNDGDSDVDGTGIYQPGGTQLYANLINNGSVVSSVAVANDGSYDFQGIADATYTVVISTSQNSTTASLPANWNNTGENVGLSGNDGTADGSVSATVSNGGNTINVNFGIQFTFPACIPPDDPNQTVGLSEDYISYEIVFSDSPTPVVGTTTEGKHAKNVVTSAGFALTKQLDVDCSDDFTNGPSLGMGKDNNHSPNANDNGIVVVSYKFWKYDYDNQGNCTLVTSCSASTGAGVGALSGNVYDDTDGDSDVDGTPIFNPASSQLHATLLDNGNNVVSSTPVANNGSYSFASLTPGSYSVVVSTSQNATSSTLPTNWINTGENVGTTGNDGNANGIVAATVTAGNTTTNVNFGIKENLGALAGNVFEDLDGDNDVDGSTIYQPAGSQLYATLLSNGAAVSSTAIAIDGSYSFTSLSAGNYSVVVSTAQNATTSTLPTNWINTGENVGTTGNDGNANGIVAATVAAGATTSNVNFGIKENLGGLAGNVYEDNNGNSDVDGSAIYNPEGAQLYATLLDNSNSVVATTPVASNGTYSFSDLSAGSYSVVISTSQNATSATIPANWIHTGENVGTTGNDGNANGIVAATVTAGATTTNVNFGIVELATISGNVYNDANGLTDNTVNGTGIDDVSGNALYVNLIDGFNNVVASQGVNPDGTYAFTGVNPGTYTVALSSSLGTVGNGVPALNLPADWQNTGENIGAGAGSDGTPDGIIGSVTATYGTSTDNVNFGLKQNDTGLSGNVFNDLNGLTDNTVNGTGINAAGATNIYVNLLDGSNNVVATQAVSNDGSYSFTGLSAGSYNVALSSALGTVGQPAPALNLSGSWITTGENVGAGAGSDGTPNGILNSVSVVLGSTTTDVNFGLVENTTAISGNVFNDDDALTDSQVDGTGVNNVGGTDIYVNLVGGDDKVVASQLVNPDGTYSFNGIAPGTYTVELSSTLGTVGQATPALNLPGSWVTSGENIGTTAPGNDGTPDGIISATAVFGQNTTDVNFGLNEIPTGLSGNVYNDADGMTDNLVDGTGIDKPNTQQLYVNISDASNNVVNVATVAADGSWIALGITPGTYTVSVSINQGTSGQATPVIELPSNWVNTGERNGAGNGHDGNMNGSLSNVAVVNGNVTTDVNFGIEERPFAGTSAEAPQGNPGGTNTVAVSSALFTATDNDGTVSSIRLTNFPTNVVTLIIDGTSYDAGTWPVNGITLPTNGNGNPLAAIDFDPIDGDISIVIPFISIDNAGVESAAPGSVTLPLTVAAGKIVNYYPALGYNSVSYEDLWPGLGDYDFNDLVVSYSFRIVSNASNSVDTMEATFVIRAIGAEYKNGFGFQFGGNIVDPADIASSSGNQLTVGYTSSAGNGLEAGQSKPTYILYENCFDIMPHPGGGGIGVNTSLLNPYVTPDTLVAKFVFSSDNYTIFDLDLANFNPFLIVNGVRGREIHLPYYEPTDLADPTYFKTSSDDSDLNSGRTYVSPNNLPWAINISGYYDYPQEKINILNTHLKFREWAESGGQLFPDWFLNRPGYRAENNIYPEPAGVGPNGSNGVGKQQQSPKGDSKSIKLDNSNK